MGRKAEPMTPHPGALFRPQSRLIGKWGRWFCRKGFYLGGGTAIALQLGHRMSVDFDWFTRRRMGDAHRLASAMAGTGMKFKVMETAPGTLHGRLGETRLSFLEYRYPLLRPLQLWREMGVNLASLEDLAAMKLSAAAQRGAKRDFIDLHALAGEFGGLSRLLGFYRNKYRTSDIQSVLYGLVYFNDAESEPSPIRLNPISWGKIKRDFEKWVKQASR